jgi:type IV pilus biogenesis protein CpaD/CtpE
MIRPVLAVCLCALLSACASRPAAPTAAVHAPAPSKDPAKPVGLSAQDLRTFFGAPAFIRQENGDEMWRYDGAGCRAFFFLYSQGDSQIVSLVETIPRGATTAADSNCLAALRARAPGS